MSTLGKFICFSLLVLQSVDAQARKGAVKYCCSQSGVSDMLWPILSFRPSPKVSFYSPSWLQTHHPLASKSAKITGMFCWHVQQKVNCFYESMSGEIVWCFPCSASFTYWHPVPSTSLQMMAFKVFKSTSRAWGNGSCSFFLPRFISTLQLVLLFMYAVLLTCRVHQTQHVCQPCVDAVPRLGMTFLEHPFPKWLLAYFYPCTLESPPVSQHWMHSGYMFTCPLIYYLSLPWVHLLHKGGDKPLVHWCSLYLGGEHIVGSPKCLLNKSFLCKMLLYRSLYSINYWEPIHRRNIVTYINLTFLFSCCTKEARLLTLWATRYMYFLHIKLVEEDLYPLPIPHPDRWLS